MTRYKMRRSATRLVVPVAFYRAINIDSAPSLSAPGCDLFQSDLRSIYFGSECSLSNMND